MAAVKVNVRVEVLHRCPGDEGALIAMSENKDRTREKWGTLICHFCGLNLKTEAYISGDEKE